MLLLSWKFSTWITTALVMAAKVLSSPGVVEPRAPSSWIHPGILMNTTQLELMKSRVASGTSPWSDAYEVMASNSLFNLSRTVSPVEMVECGSYSNPDVGCTAEREDSIASYSMALAWYITGEAKYATKAIYYMDAWSSVIIGHNNSNAPLQSGWVGSVWARTAEIIRYSDAGWSDDGIAQFKTMLTDVYLPEVIGGDANANGNWELVMMEAAIFIAIFTEDVDSYNTGMTGFLDRVPAYIYLTSDGDIPIAPVNSSYTTTAKLEAYWYGQTTFVDGLCQETCRDMEHTGYGIASISHVAETSRIQGTDLFVEETGERLKYALEFHSYYALEGSFPSWLCDGTLTGVLDNVTEIGHTEFVSRLGDTMGNTTKYTEEKRPGGENGLFVLWETLTHARL
ncbi:Chondroitin AC/alginate lyase [Penicillium odoratum]|uniref:Chondroitin AC/alginate lyase n=1 Tax=Penicillium odoratum TaxID=1167516 RepID=UPI002548A547|nr:Chondroitin AC/alginate lyase [Penicillium odoratum]KAJ5765697.1 Chondroitin AC/alginate lyase [Penicillium odoratum]